MGFSRNVTRSAKYLILSLYLHLTLQWLQNVPSIGLQDQMPSQIIQYILSHLSYLDLDRVCILLDIARYCQVAVTHDYQMDRTSCKKPSNLSSVP
jgi:hypothetical protein